MLQRPNFKDVRLPHSGNDSEGTTQMMNLKSKNLFEVYNAAEIYDGDISNLNDSGSFDSSKVQVKSVILEDTCFIAVDRMVHCFKVGSRADDCCAFELDDSPVDVCIVPGQKIIMFLLQNGTVCFFVPSVSKLTSSFAISDGSANNYTATFGGFGPFLSLCVLAKYDSYCEAKFIKFAPFYQIGKGSDAFFSGLKVLKTSERLDHCHVAGDKFGFAFFPKRKDNAILKQCVYSLHQSALAGEPLNKSYRLPYGAKSVHQIGKLVGVLTECLECVLFNDLQDLVPAGTLQLGNFRGDIIDFAVLDFDGFVLNPNNRMVIHINNGSKDKIVLTDVQSSAVAFEFECSSNICLNSVTAQTEMNNNVVIVESFSAKRPNSVQLRFIFEAQPEIRLRNLLDRHRFEEALDCARVYKLPLNRVYEKQVAFLVDGITHDGLMSNDDLDKLLALLKNLAATMEESALDYAFLAVTTATEYSHIGKLLAFCHRCTTTDENLTDSINTLQYALESYILLFGNQASFERTSHWPQFWTGSNHWDLFVKFLSEAQIKKCSQFWERYRVTMSDLLVKSAQEFFPELLSLLERTISGSSGPEMCYEISNFLQKDLLPPFFNEENCIALIPFQTELADFFKRVSLSLWQLDQQNFPQNAHYFSSTLKRITDALTSSNSDAKEKEKIIRCLDRLEIGSLNIDAPYIEVDRMVVKLAQLSHLKKSYKFVSSYEAFHNLSAEEIGSLLLDKIYTTPNCVGYVKEVVFVYCKEVGLDRDMLLLNYIKKADLSKIVKICIEMCKLFKNDDYRAEAAMLIAPSCHLPWSSELNQLFRGLIAIQLLPEMTQQQLKETVLIGRISLIMTRYSGGFMLEILDSNDLIDYCTTLFAYIEVPIADRVKDAQQICQLSKQNTKIATSQANCFVAVIKRSYAIAKSMDELNDTLELLSCIEDLDVLNEVASKCALYAYKLLSSKGISDESIPLCANFLIRIAQYLPVSLKSKYIQKASSVCQLYELQCRRVFKDFGQIVDVDVEKPVRELIEIGSLLSLSKEEVVIHLILYFVNSQRVDRIEAIINLIPIIIEEPKSDEFIEAIYFGMSYLVTIFSDYNWTHLDIVKLADFVESIKKVTAWIFEHTANEIYLSKFSTVLEYVNFLEDSLGLCKFIDASSSNASMNTDEHKIVSHEEEVFVELESLRNSPIYVSNGVPRVDSLNSILSGLCKVAESVCQPIVYLKGWQSNVNNTASVYRTQWISLVTILGKAQLDLLAVEAAQLCLKMELFNEHQQDILVLYDSAVVNLVFGQISTPNIDWISITENMGFRGLKQSTSIVRAVRGKDGLLRNRVAVVNSYLLKFAFLDPAHTESNENFGQFYQLCWQRELATHGVVISSRAVNSLDQLLDKLASQLVSPSVIASLCRSFKHDVNLWMRSYVVHLCIAHSTKQSTKRSAILKVAQETLDSIVNPSADTIRQLLLAIDQIFSPYDYDAIELVLNWCNKHVNDSELSDWVGQMSKLLAFLRIHKRRAIYTEEELEWVSARIHGTQIQNEETMANETRREKDKVVSIEDDPLQLSLTRLPFQVFLTQDDSGKEIRRAIVTDQVTTETLQDWIKLAIQLPRVLPYSRVFFESSSICADLKRCLERRISCDEKLMIRALTIIRENPNFVTLLSHLSAELAEIVQSEHKVKIFEQFTSLLDKRIKAQDGTITDQASAKVIYKKLVSCRNIYFVLNLLTKYNLLDKKTVDLAGKGSELCKYIFTRITKWNDLDNIAAHIKFVQELEKQGLVSMRKIFDELIAEWLSNYKIDLNASGGRLDVSMEVDEETVNVVKQPKGVPYFLHEITRMAFFLKHRCTKELADTIKGLDFLPNEDGPAKRIQVCCVIFRAFNNEKVEDLFGKRKDLFLQ